MNYDGCAQIQSLIHTDSALISSLCGGHPKYLSCFIRQQLFWNNVCTLWFSGLHHPCPSQMSDYPRSQVPDGLGLWQEAGQVRVQPLRLQFNPQKNDERKKDERKDKMIVCVGASSSAMSVLSIYIQVSRNSPPDLSRQGLMEKETNAFKSCVGEQRFYRLLEYSEEKPRDSFWKCMYMAAVRAV